MGKCRFVVERTTCQYCSNRRVGFITLNNYSVNAHNIIITAATLHQYNKYRSIFSYFVFKRQLSLD